MKFFKFNSSLYIYSSICFLLSLSIQGPDELAQYRLISNLGNSALDSTVFLNLNSIFLLLYKSFINFFAIFYELIFNKYTSFIEDDLITNFLYLPLSGEQVTYNNKLFFLPYLLLKIPQFIVIIIIINISIKKNLTTVLFALCIPSTIPILLNITTDYLSYLISIFIIYISSNKFFFIKVLILILLTIYLDNNFFPILIFYCIHFLITTSKINISNFQFLLLVIVIIALIRLHIYIKFDNLFSNYFYMFHFSYEENLLKYARQFLILVMSFWYLDGSMSYMAFGPEYLILPLYVVLIFKFGSMDDKNYLFSVLIVIVLMMTSVIVFSHSRFYLFLLPILYPGYKISKNLFKIKAEYMYTFPLIGISYKVINFAIFSYATFNVK